MKENIERSEFDKQWNDNRRENRLENIKRSPEWMKRVRPPTDRLWERVMLERLKTSN